ncbi:MAG: radical SAM protein [Nitrospina sp.]|nr:radical SAM protein [Nitrospina sp.]
MINTKTALTFLKGVVTKKSPMYVQFALAKGCNIKCLMCSVVENRSHEKELTLSDIDVLAHNLDKMGVSMLILTGGEPFLRKDLSEVVRIFKKHHIESRLQTNGLLVTEENLQAVIDAGVSEVTISLDTLNIEKQDVINQKEGSYFDILRALALFSKMFPIKGNMTGVNTVVSKSNIHEIPALIDFVTQIGFYVSLIPAHLTDEETKHPDEDTSYLLRKGSEIMEITDTEHNAIDQAYEKIIQMKRDGYHVHNSNRFLRESPDFLKFKKVHWKCSSPDLYFSISPEGRFLPCVDLEIPMDIHMTHPDFLKHYKEGNFIGAIKEKVAACPGCMYACYPEIHYFCRDTSVFIERLFQGAKISRLTRKVMNFDEMVDLAEKIREQYQLKQKNTLVGK